MYTDTSTIIFSLQYCMILKNMLHEESENEIHRVVFVCVYHKTQDVVILNRATISKGLHFQLSRAWGQYHFDSHVLQHTLNFAWTGQK